LDIRFRFRRDGDGRWAAVTGLALLALIFVLAVVLVTMWRIILTIVVAVGLTVFAAGLVQIASWMGALS
jgi:hypothetical protein